MASEKTEVMPDLRVLRVDEVPTVKADPVDPVAREQAKVRSMCVCVCVCVGGVRAAATASTGEGTAVVVSRKPRRVARVTGY